MSFCNDIVFRPSIVEKTSMALVPLSSYEQSRISINNDGTPDTVVFVSSSGSVGTVSYNNNGYKMNDTSNLTGIAFVAPEKGVIKKFSIQCYAAEDDTSGYDADHRLVLHFQLYATTGGISDFNLDPVSGGEITATITNNFSQEDVLVAKTVSLNKPISAGTQFTVVFYGEVVDANGDNTSFNYGNPTYGIVGGINLIQTV